MTEEDMLHMLHSETAQRMFRDEKLIHELFHEISRTTDMTCQIERHMMSDLNLYCYQPEAFL